MDTESIWTSVLSCAKEKINPQTFERWFAPCKPKALTKTSFVIEVPNIFHQNWMAEHYSLVIEDILKKNFANPPRLEIQINPELEELLKERENATGSEKEEKIPEEIPSRPRTSYFGDNNGGTLNPRYTFENFVEGPSNGFARAGALAVAQAPGKAYNPLFIYGGVGLGKTHLMQAIGHYLLGRRRNAKVYYSSSEIFTNQLIYSLQNRQIESFRKKYRTMDALMIDDIHFLSGKEQTQEEFFHTFNTLHDHGAQIVVSSDRPPKELKAIADRLVSRFEWGLVVDLQVPDFETRTAIIRKKAELENLQVPDDVLYFIANRIKSNIRQLEGALTKVISYASLMRYPLSVSLAETVLQDILSREDELIVSIESIQKVVAEHFDIRVADLKGNRKPKNIVQPRMIAMYLCREMTGMSLQEIGDAFGGRDHSTIIHGHKTISDRIENDLRLKMIVTTIKKKIERV